MFRTRVVALVVSVASIAGVVGACGQEFDRDAAVDSFKQANPDVTDSQAGCVIDRQIDRFGLDGLTAELEAETPTDEFIEVQFRDMFACGIDGDIEEQLVEQLVASGVSDDQAPCVADRIVGQLDDDAIDVLVSGEISDTFMATFVAAVEDCGAGQSGG